MRDLSLHLIDIIQNSISAKATNISIRIRGDLSSDKLILAIDDNGIGMDGEVLKQVENPFYTTRTTRKVGLGISLLKASAEISGGRFEIKSVLGVGTTIKADFQISNIDRLPLGDISETLISVIIANPEINFELFLENIKDKFEFRTLDVKEKIGDLSITQLEVIDWIKEYIIEGTKTIFGGVLNEITS